MPAFPKALLRFGQQLKSPFATCSRTYDTSFAAPDFGKFLPGIPPSFAGFCGKCIFTYRDRDRNGGFRHHLPKSRKHFDNSELEEFLANMAQYGTSRRLFATDHSLGFGPKDLQDWDEVWFLEGASVPLILRRVGGHYTLVGACYIQGANRTTDRCPGCCCEIGRTTITVRQPWAGGMFGSDATTSDWLKEIEIR
jgi:hypothetical protein